LNTHGGACRLLQIAIAQMHRDDSIKCLVETMTDICKFMIESEPLKRVSEAYQTKSQDKIIEILAAMAAQVTECAYFIRGYAHTKGFCESTVMMSSVISHCAMSVSKAVKHSFSDADSQVRRYVDKFTELKLAFNGRAILHIDITVLRILDKVEDFGE
jgi:hypothetical protein